LPVDAVSCVARLPSPKSSHVSSVQPFEREIAGLPPVRGFLHVPEEASGDALVLTHGAGANCQSPLLVALADAFCEKGMTVLRCDLPFRQERKQGPPIRTAERDQQGLKAAIAALSDRAPGRVFLGGHSYGGRMASMLAAREPELMNALLSLSYPLHPPRKAEQLRTAHFADLRTPALFVSGTRDPFGTIDEISAALKLIPAQTQLLAIEGSGHELAANRNREEVVVRIVEALRDFSTNRGRDQRPTGE